MSTTVAEIKLQNNSKTLDIVTFFGGKEKGKCIQLSFINNGVPCAIQLTMEDAKNLIEAISTNCAVYLDPDKLLLENPEAFVEDKEIQEFIDALSTAITNWPSTGPSYKILSYRNVAVKITKYVDEGLNETALTFQFFNEAYDELTGSFTDTANTMEAFSETAWNTTVVHVCDVLQKHCSADIQEEYGEQSNEQYVIESLSEEEEEKQSNDPSIGDTVYLRDNSYSRNLKTGEKAFLAGFTDNPLVQRSLLKIASVPFSVKVNDGDIEEMIIVEDENSVPYLVLNNVSYDNPDNKFNKITRKASSWKAKDLVEEFKRKILVEKKDCVSALMLISVIMYQNMLKLIAVRKPSKVLSILSIVNETNDKWFAFIRRVCKDQEIEAYLRENDLTDRINTIFFSFMKTLTNNSWDALTQVVERNKDIDLILSLDKTINTFSKSCVDNLKEINAFSTCIETQAGLNNR